MIQWFKIFLLTVTFTNTHTKEQHYPKPFVFQQCVIKNALGLEFYYAARQKH